MFFNEADDASKKIATLTISLHDIFGVDQFFEVVVFFIPEDELFMLIEEVVDIAEFRGYVEFCDSFGVCGIGFICKIKIFDEMVDSYGGKKWFNGALFIEIWFQIQRNLVGGNAVFLLKQNLSFDVFYLRFSPFVISIVHGHLTAVDGFFPIIFLFFWFHFKSRFYNREDLLLFL